MAKSKPVFKIKSFGIYNQWNAKEKKLPEIQEFTTNIKASLDVEFGFIINIKKAKCEKEVYITNNDWDFYLGDTIWLPIENKLGLWRMTIELKGDVIAEKKFSLCEDLPSAYLY
jgi:hypothetical protein